jgi:hypothetical protein
MPGRLVFDEIPVSPRLAYIVADLAGYAHQVLAQHLRTPEPVSGPQDLHQQNIG